MALTVLAALPLTDDQRKMILDCGDIEILEVPPQPDPDLLAGLAERTEVWFGPRLRPHLLTRSPGLRWVQLVSAGVDRYMFPELVGSQIVVTNCKGMHAGTIADHVYALILAFARGLPHFIRAQIERRWDRRLVRELSETRLAVVGLGGIGSLVAQRGKAFGMEVTGVVRRPREIPGVERVVGPDRLLEAISGADWVVIACPLTPETHHLIGESELDAMGPGSHLINIGRGKIVDEASLIQALREERVAGAGLDVFEEEPLSEDSPLWELPNVIITPHIAGSLGDQMAKATEIFCENLRRYQLGETLINLVDKKLGY